MYRREILQFDRKQTTVYFDAGFDTLKEVAAPDNSFIITDENLMLHYAEQIKPWRCIVIAAGETSKNLEVIDDIVRQLIALEADRDAAIIGLGGGVVTDIAGFVASIYKRGVRFGYVPSSVLGMVDASVGGKNGVDTGAYKNMVGIIRQPDFLLYNYEVLKTLPDDEWINGFAEIIKHACIKDARLFQLLEQHSINDFKKDANLLHQLIESNVSIKAGIVQNDEYEKGERKLLNFGHTFGHAIENTCGLPHGHAVAVGMVVACKISEQLLRFRDTEKIKRLIEQYHLPATIEYMPATVLPLMAADKKRFSDQMDYILLENIGRALIHKIAIDDLSNILQEIRL